MSLKTLPALVAVSAVLCFAPPRAARAQISFTSIVDTTRVSPTGGLFNTFLVPAFSGGNVAFFGGSSSGASGIFASTGAGGAIVAVASNLPGAGFGGGTFTSFGVPQIDGGNVAFFAADATRFGIYTNTGPGGALREIASNAPGGAPGGATFTTLGNLDISGTTVVFEPGTDTGVFGVFANTGAGGSVIPLATNASIAPDGGTFNSVGGAYLDGGSVSFVGTYGGFSRRGIFSVPSSGGAITELVSSGLVVPGVGTVDYFSSLAASGSNLTFLGDYGGGVGPRGVFARIGGAIVTLATNAPGQAEPSFANFGRPAISGATVAFLGYDANFAQSTIFANIGAAGSVARVIGVGDSLFGGTVSGVSFDQNGLDGADLAFSYTLTNGRSGIARASLGGTSAAPEPGTLALMALAVAVALPRRRRK